MHKCFYYEDYKKINDIILFTKKMVLNCQKVFPQHYMHSNMFKSSSTHRCFICYRVVEELDKDITIHGVLKKHFFKMNISEKLENQAELFPCYW